jgi:5'-nucleotidase
MAPDRNASGLSTSITCLRPLHAYLADKEEGIEYYACDGTPADCVKMGYEHFCPRRPDLLLSGINYGSNSSINIISSGTMGAVLEGCLNGLPSIGLSLLSHKPEADFNACSPTIRHILRQVLQKPLPDFTALNVNIPHLPAEQIKGIRICRQARAAWEDSLEKHLDAHGKPFWTMTGRFVCNNPEHDTDEYCLSNGYVSVVPVSPDFTNRQQIPQIKNLEL